jgi:hypothetical protein
MIDEPWDRVQHVIDLIIVGPTSLGPVPTHRVLFRTTTGYPQYPSRSSRDRLDHPGTNAVRVRIDLGEHTHRLVGSKGYSGIM